MLDVWRKIYHPSPSISKQTGTLAKRSLEAYAYLHLGGVMDDKTIIELCAKAMGFKIDKSPYNGGGANTTGFDTSGNAVLDWRNGKTFNPLHNSANYEQMEAELGLHVRWFNDSVAVSDNIDVTTCDEKFADHNGDKRAAKRRAGCLVGAEG